MRMTYLTPTVACLLFCATGAARAGLYNTAENNEEILSQDFRKFRNVLDKFRFVAESPFSKRVDLVNKLASDQRLLPNLTDEERLNLSAYLIRKGRSDAADDVLQEAAAGRQSNCLLFANRGTAKQLLRKYPEAAYYLQRGLDAWPKRFDKLDDKQRKFFLSIGWNEAQFGWFRKVEEYHLKLVHLRKQAGEQYHTVDALFPLQGQPLRFVGKDGTFEAGRIAGAEKAKLPDDAVEIVEQLLIWFPLDNRLYWLLGEVFNAQGDYDSAYEIFGWVARNERGQEKLARELRKRQSIIDEYRERQAKGQTNQGAANPPPPNSGTGQDAKTPTIRPDDRDGWNPNPWHMLAVGSFTGVVVTLFASWQVRSLRRRR